MIDRDRGDRGGGGTEVTPEGKALLETYSQCPSDGEAYARAAFGRRFAGWSSPGGPRA
jgi:molybdenum-dependent DNA-binding transcriptional regulator ModE